MLNQMPMGIPNQNMYFPNPLGQNMQNYDYKIYMLETKVKEIENKINNIEKKLNMQTSNNQYDYQNSMYMM